MATDSPGHHVPNDREYGHNVEVDRDYESLTPRQQRIIDLLVDNEQVVDDEALNFAEIADEAGTSQSYVSYVNKKFPHIVDFRADATQVAADGGSGYYNLRVSEGMVWELIRVSGKETSQYLFNQVRKQDEA